MRTFWLVALLPAALLGCKEPRASSRAYARFVETTLAGKNESLGGLLETLKAPGLALEAGKAGADKHNIVYELATPASGVRALVVETMLAQGKERVTGARMRTRAGEKALKVPKALRERGLPPLRAANLVRPKTEGSRQLATMLTVLSAAAEAKGAGILGLCQAMKAKCAPAEGGRAESTSTTAGTPTPTPTATLTSTTTPSTSTSTGAVAATSTSALTEAWRCATAERWASSEMSLFSSARACTTKRADGKTIVVYDLTLAPDSDPRPPVTLPGMALLKHRAVTATLAAETLLARVGDPARGSVRYSLDLATPGDGPLAVRRILVASALLCGSGGVVEGCVSPPAVAATPTVARAPAGKDAKRW